MLEPKNARSTVPAEARLQYLLHLVQKKRRSSTVVRAMVKTYYNSLSVLGQKQVVELLLLVRLGLSEKMSDWFTSMAKDKPSKGGEVSAAIADVPTKGN